MVQFSEKIGWLVTSLQQHKYVLVCSDFLLECVWHLDTLIRELFIEDNGYIPVKNRMDSSASRPSTHTSMESILHTATSNSNQKREHRLH